MSNKLGGKQGTAYLGTNANQPPNWVFAVKDPTQYDVNNVTLGDLWLNQTNGNVWVLVSLKGIPGSHGSLATWAQIESGGVSSVNSLTGNTGGTINPDSGGNINVVGDGVGITIAGNAGTHTLTASLVGGGSAATSFPTDSGTAAPISGVLNIKAGTSLRNAGSSVEFTGSTNNITFNVTDSNSNTLIGSTAGGVTTTGTANTGIGQGACSSLSSGIQNTVVGAQAGHWFTTGSFNALVGYEAGNNYTSGGESSNININSPGVTSESNVLRIGNGTGTGSQQINKSFIYGIRGITPATADGIPVFIGSAGQLGTVGSGGSTLISTLTGNTGGAVSPSAGNINIVGDGTTIEITGNPGTNTLTVVGLGGGGGDLSQLSGDTGMALPSSGIINVIAGTSSQHSGSSVSFSGTGNTLTLNLTDAHSNTIIGNGSGNSSITGTDNVVLGVGSGTAITTGTSNVIIGGLAATSMTGGDQNIIIGHRAGAAAVATTNNVFIGYDAGIACNDDDNIFIGTDAGSALTVGSQNVLIGPGSGESMTSCLNNTFVGYATANNLLTGVNNVVIGWAAGTNYSANESNNILIGMDVTGTAGESNALHIGTGTGTGTGQLNKSFIAGIRGITPGTNDGIPVYIGSTGQLGTVGSGGTSVINKLTGNSGGAVAPTAGNINVVGDGVSVNVVGNPGTSTLTISAVGGAGGPSFFAYLTTTTANVTGDSTVYTIIYDTLPVNSGSAFNLGTSTFTAPVTGVYNFSILILCEGNIYGTQQPATAKLNTTSKTFSFAVGVGFLQGSSVVRANYGQAGYNFYTNMTAGDTAFVTIACGPSLGGSKSISLDGTSGSANSILTGIVNYFSGSLV
jgi:hypothetical protein